MTISRSIRILQKRLSAHGSRGREQRLVNLHRFLSKLIFEASSNRFDVVDVLTLSSGCLTCRKRRIKCDEGKPICNNCQKSRRQCEGYNQRIVFKPTDYQYFPHGAATITWHSGFVPGDEENIIHADPMAHGYSQLRPRIAPQQQMIDLAGIQQHQHVMQQQHMGMPPPDQGSLPQTMAHSLDNAQQWGMPGRQQGQALPASSLPYYPPHYDQHPHILSAPGHVVHDLGWQQRHNSMFNDCDAQPPIAQEVYPPAPTPGWQQVPPQLPLRHDSRQHASPERSRSWYELPPSRIKISHTTTTVEHEWPAQMYAPRPELLQPIDRDRVTHRVMPTPQFQATQLYDQADATFSGKFNVLLFALNISPARPCLTTHAR